VKAQNFSNKGKDFWLGYGYHVNMAGNPAGGGSQEMVLYFTSDKNANVTVDIPGINYTKTYTVLANQVTETAAIPKSGTQDARVYDTGYYNRGIHITSDADIVAYAHIYNSSVSGASLLFPTNTLGKDYYVISYNQSSNADKANSFAFVVAVEDNTTVEITPSVINKNNKAASTPFLVTLNKGQIYSLMGTTSGVGTTASPYVGTDLTGTRIRTISSGGSCKQIAVFCGAGKLSIGGTTANNNQTGSADNTFAQSLPASAWGLKYLTAPTGSQPNNYFRICVTDPTTVVKLNGVQIPSTYLQRSFFYELKNSTVLSTPGNGIGIANTSGVYNLIESDKPINVAQYCTTQGMDGNPSSPGDPEMIYLSPVEQTINKITLNSTPHYAITQHFINVVIKKGGVNSFTLDGASKSGSFKPHPQDASYSYAIFQVTQGSHALYSDTGFNSIAYGFGSAESYGYNAGTNIKDLYTPVFQNPYARLSFAATCVGTPFQFSVPLSYQPTSLTWDFGTTGNISPGTAIGPVTPKEDSLVSIGGQNLYYYSPANGVAGGKTFTYKNPGVDTIKLFATNPSPDGCSSSNAEYDIPVVINSIPLANFSVRSTKCISEFIQFTDSSTNLGTSTVINGLWNWDDGTTDSLKNPAHKFPVGKTYNIRYKPITDFGCIGDTTIPFDIASAAIPKFGYSDSCVGKTITFSDSSSIVVGTIVKWYWDYGDGTKDTLTANTPRTKTFNATGMYAVSLVVENNTGCKSNPFIQNITIRPLPKTNFVLPNAVCLPVGFANFVDSTTIDAGNSIKIWRWDFGDGGIDSVQNPVHNYTATTNYTVKLTAISGYGCMKDSSKVLSNIYPQPKTDFTILNQVCLHDTTLITSSSVTYTGNNVTIAKRFWNFGDGGIDSVQTPKHLYAAAGTDTVKFSIITDKGCLSDTAIKITVVNPLPIAGFKTVALDNYCERKPIQFIDTAKNQSINAASLTRWYWDMGNGNTRNLSAGGLNTFFYEYYPSFSNYNVRMMVENSLGCKSDTVTSVLNIHGLPSVGFILPEICLDDAVANFSDTTTIPDGSTASSYLWGYNVGTPAVTPGPTVTSSTAKDGATTYKNYGNYVVSLKVTTSFGCDSVLSQPFTVNGSTPKANFIVSDSSILCSNKAITIIDSSWVNFGSVTKNEIYWDLAAVPAADSIDDNPYFKKSYVHSYTNFAQPKSKSIQIKMIAHSGKSPVCVNTVTKTITLHQSPIVQFNSLRGICNDTTPQSIKSAAIETGGVDFISKAFYGTGVDTTGIYNPQTVIPGSYPIMFRVITPYGCRDSSTQSLTVWPSPVAKWGINWPDCEKNSITFTDSSVANYKNIAKRYWIFGDGKDTTVYYKDSVLTHAFNSYGSYAVQLKVISDSGCRSVINSQVIKINPLPVLSYLLPSICLPDGKGQFINTSTIPDASESLFSYLWNFGDTNDATPSTLKSPVHQYSALGPYTVKLKIISKDGCTDSLSSQLTTVYPQPKASFISSKTNICLGDTVLFTDNSNGITGSIISWHWSIDADSLYTNTALATKTFKDSGSFIVKLYTYNQQNCISDTALQNIVVNPYPKLTLGPDLVVLLGGSIKIIPKYVYGDSLSYLWVPSTYLNSDTASRPIATPDVDVHYSLWLTGIGNCTVSDTINVTVLKLPVIPNAFSPNGDGINDTWQIKYLNSYPDAIIDVYDRYGMPVFHSQGYDIDWDGTFRGKPLPIGTYYYVINPKNGRSVMSGSVTIIR
jgi:gliding motility-associated-like protein